MRVKQIARPNQTKVCPMCNRDLPLEAYSKGTGMYGRRSVCKECDKLLHNTPEVRERRRLRRIERIPPLEVRRQRHRVQVIKSYGITEEEFNSMLEKQDGKCAICGTTDWGKPSPSIDHNHRTGKVRALLCNRCNRVLGLAEDSPELLSKMSNYLKEHGTED